MDADQNLTYIKQPWDEFSITKTQSVIPNNITFADEVGVRAHISTLMRTNIEHEAFLISIRFQSDGQRKKCSQTV